jgi:hypothetical protein
MVGEYSAISISALSKSPQHEREVLAHAGFDSSGIADTSYLFIY